MALTLYEQVSLKRDVPADSLYAGDVATLVELVQAKITHRWAASVRFTSGILPVFEQVRENVWAIGGYNGTGNLIGALCGRAAAQLAVAGDTRLAKHFT